MKNHKIYLKEEKKLKLWDTYNVLHTSQILLFFRSMVLKLKNNIELNYFLIDQNIVIKSINRHLVNKLISQNSGKKIKNYNGVLCLKKKQKIVEIENIIKKKGHKILGYYMDKIFFYKKDKKKIYIDKKELSLLIMMLIWKKNLKIYGNNKSIK